ncbi:MAG TPA: alpha-glucan family phosphorylase [Candidatus Saccharicenans sp.]|nr:alpha-glucan family phosphorylase [Candidatus Saccharicenans sp.]HOL45498.1 alpha-glucan family phosphorylase [Candidatus Saccharicenans sp.]HOM94721.1 alpha-glucan family phosphorylase [Candidatus Saccharicenans sp.]HPC88383.1 alpha-glucan family phosphorylase [Candidatus Saccharicenans sp.]HPP23894.1 alpha-glucan family phosphorylase [Candidatus Saccharicenans sp.]
MNRNKKDRNQTVAYFSMEIGIDNNLHTYSGGLGVLAGDTLRAAADLNVPLVGLTLIHRQGYLRQKLSADGWQTEEPDPWEIEQFLQAESPRISVIIEGRQVQVRAWRYDVRGIRGFEVPVYFLDTNLPENTEFDRSLTDFLYGGDEHYRLCQEIILGVGGVRMLRALGYEHLKIFHLNEGHSALLILELLDEEARRNLREAIADSDKETVRNKCVFTTHTPVPAGHDQFPIDLVKRVLGDRNDFFALDGVLYEGRILNMTGLALNFSRYVNGVARKHGEISRLMYAGYEIESITNGVHAATWVSEPFRELFDRYMPIWRQDNFSLRYALSIPKMEIWLAHLRAKRKLLAYVREKTGVDLDENTLTIGFARRATAYKRANLLFSDIDRLRKISQESGALQIIYAGKAHPRDIPGKELIKQIFQAKMKLAGDIEVIYLENYDLHLGALMTAGVDLWLNTPQPPLEASGTSGMKACLNGVPNLSVLDGWWVEGHLEGLTGWAIEENTSNQKDEVKPGEAEVIYEKLETKIIPIYYKRKSQFIDIMAHCIAINGSFFNTQRMMQEYVLNAYFTD